METYCFSMFCKSQGIGNVLDQNSCSPYLEQWTSRTEMVNSTGWLSRLLVHIVRRGDFFSNTLKRFLSIAFFMIVYMDQPSLVNLYLLILLFRNIFVRIISAKNTCHPVSSLLTLYHKINNTKSYQKSSEDEVI